MAKLFLVGTPIGNLKDITLRAIETLENVQVIACEDTRHSLILLNAYEIKKPLISVHKFNEKTKSQDVLNMLKEGKDVAYISDAGMPLISDPGFILLNDAKKAGFDVEVIPGVTAFSTALVGSGLSTEHFTFLGFLPEKQKDKKMLLEKYENLDSTLIFYSSSHNISKDLQTFYEFLGDRRVAVANELTKKFEKYIEGTLKELKIDEPKGEYVVLIEGRTHLSPLNDLSLEEHFAYYTNDGLSKNEAIKKVAQDRGVKKDEIYKHFIKGWKKWLKKLIT